MEIPLNAQVECTDGVCGHSVFVLINPIGEEITHLVVREGSSSNKEYIVPVDLVAERVADTIQLRCSKAEMEKMDPFIVTRYIKDKVPEKYARDGGVIYEMGSTYYLPYNAPDITLSTPVDEQQIPPGELAVYRGTRVEATDGYVGKVDEFIVNPENCHITHLVMREGHLWGKKDVIIPLAAMGEIREDTVYLKLDKHQIEALPTFPVRRRWA
jgi:sporulation protein YlmC with PRC-barrel domain